MTATAKLFKNGRSQAVRLPREFRFEGDRVRVRRAGLRAPRHRDHSFHGIVITRSTGRDHRFHAS